MHFEPFKYSSSRWCPKLVTDEGPNIVYGYDKFTSRKRCTEWCDRMNAAATKVHPQLEETK
jgi:hypothetical protein